ncbi:MAG: pectate lyase [Planctomycetota bacterium]
MHRRSAIAKSALLSGCGLIFAGAADSALATGPTFVAPDDSLKAVIRRAASSFCARHQKRGGYVYFYHPDGKWRHGEGPAAKQQIWVQPPGTPVVGMALLHGFLTTGDETLMHYAADAAMALVRGQLESGGWTNKIDFDATGDVARYRHPEMQSKKSRSAKNNSSLDDDQTPAAMRFLLLCQWVAKSRGGMKPDDFRQLSDSLRVALDALLDAQIPGGAFPQVWAGRRSKVSFKIARNAQSHFLRNESDPDGRVKNYWEYPTLNDNVCGNVVDTLLLFYARFKSARPRIDAALRALGQFLISAQLPSPQPGWAQQYNLQLQPLWARRFEPPCIATDETQEIIQTLMVLARHFKDERYLQPIPLSLNYLRRHLTRRPDAPDLMLPRMLQMRSDRPIFMARSGGKAYRLTYDPQQAADHYGWWIEDQTATLRRSYEILKKQFATDALPAVSQELYDLVDRQCTRFHIQRTTIKWSTDPAAILAGMQADGRWVDEYEPSLGRLVGQPKFRHGLPFVSSQTFHDNLVRLSRELKNREG